MRFKVAVPLLLLLLASLCLAQEITGDIRGIVRDTSGAVVPNAKVTITNTDRNVVIRTLTTNSEGAYAATLLPVGHYDISVDAANFKKTTAQKIELNVNDHRVVDFALKVGGNEEQVNVTESPVAVNLETPSAEGLITGTQVRELAINTRNYEQLVALQPGVTTGLASDQLYVGATSPTGLSNQINFSVNGGRPTQNNWNVDGADNVDRGANLTLLTYPSIDSIAEFKVLRSNYNPEHGRSSSGEINVITRSGTSAFHGSAYEFFRNDVLNANNFFNNHANPVVERPPLRYNDFGFTFGGPVYIPHVYNDKKDKTFFFYSQEWRRVITNTTFHSGELPTAAELAGTFPTPVCLNAACTSTGTQITSIDPTAQAYIKDIFSKLPAPNQPDNTLIFTGTNVFNYREESIRVDHVFNQKFSVFGRFLDDSIPTQEPGGIFTGSALPGVATTKSNSPGRSLSFHATMSLTPTLLNDAGYAYSYGAVISDPVGLGATANATDVHPTLPFRSTIPRVPDLAFGDGEGLFGFGSYRDFNRNHNIFDNLSKAAGHHNLKFGVSYNHYNKNENFANGNNGSFSFSDTSGSPSDGTFQQEFANFLIGNVAQFTQANIDARPDIIQHQLEMYGQDEWRIRPNLTLSYGVRYSLFMQPTDQNLHASTFDPAAYNPAQTPQLDAKGQLVPGTQTPILNGVIIGGVNSPFGDSVARTPKKNFAPRIGIAWDPTGKGKTSIRSGYGIFYDSPAVNVIEQFDFTNLPAVQNVSIFNTSLSNPAAVAAAVDLAPPAIGGVNTNWHQPYTQQWSLDVQHQLTSKAMIDVGYYGTKGTHLVGVVDINQPLPGAYRAAGLVSPTKAITAATTPLLNLVRPFQGFDAINLFSPIFGSNYHSLQSQFQYRISDSSIVAVNYTWSHAMTDAQSDFRTPQNTYDIHSEYGPAQFDRRHVLTASYVYNLPWLKSQEGFVGHVLGGWELSGIVYAYSGLPLTVTGGSPSIDPAGLGLLDALSFSGRRPDMNGNPNDGAPHTIAQWFNTSVFSNPPVTGIRPGNERRGTVRGPGAGRWDASLFKNTKLSERFGLQFRVEAFNVLNHTNFDAIGTNAGSRANFGKVLTARDPRIMQLGLKLLF